jgi:hypothetical protein
MKIPFRRPILASALALAFPAHALACAVCAGGNPANRFAFFGSTIVLSLLPLGLFVGGFLWLRSKLRRQGSSEFVERDPLSEPPRPTVLETSSKNSGEEPHSPPVPAR